MDFFASLIYGVIQGITEFAPVSSSGHLALIPKFFKFKDPGVLFDLSMHVGTAFAVLLYYRDEVWGIIKAFFRLFLFEGVDYENKNFAINMFVSTLTTFILVLVIKLFLKDLPRSGLFIALNLAIFGILMYLSDRKDTSEFSLITTRSYKASFLVGFAQAFAIFPGVSRSGITLTASRMLGLSRKNASDYSFLLSLPVIFGGFAIELCELGTNSIEGSVLEMLLGMGISFVCGIVTIHFFIKSISKIGLLPFAIYRIILALVVLKFLYY